MTSRPLDLKKITQAIFDANTHKNEYAFQSDAGVENLFTLSYKTRYFLELLQNSRDAVVEGRVDKGKVRAWVEDGHFYFANNGADFTEPGVWSICFPAISTKKDLTMVGHKGIGFNAVREISSRPEIITRFGTFFFDIEQAAALLGRKGMGLPLFKYPMFREYTIDSFGRGLAEAGFTTLFRFPLDSGVGEDGLELEIPAAEDIVFLSAIKELDINGIKTKLDDEQKAVSVTHRDIPRNFLQYRHHIKLTPEDIATFSSEEQQQFRDSHSAEFSFLLETHQDGSFKKNPKARLHLFYGLEIETGLSFSLHSYFSVTIDRKRLIEKSALNHKLFQAIANYYCNELVQQLKKDFAQNELGTIAYRREKNNELTDLYDLIRDGLKDRAFIFHQQLGIYLRPADIYLVSEAEYQVFRDGILGDRYLYIQDAESWFLKGEMGVSELPNQFILDHLEAKCIRYQQDPKFFERLYKLIENRGIYAHEKSVLLTQNGTLTSGTATEIYYQVKNDYRVPVILEKDIAFLHGEIDIENLRAGLKKYLSLNEFDEKALVTRAIKILKEQQSGQHGQHELTRELLNFLVQLEFHDEDHFTKLRAVTMLPVTTARSKAKSWANPVPNPIYFSDFAHADLYQDDYLVFDPNELGIQDMAKWRPFLLKLGVWEIPGVILGQTIAPAGSPYAGATIDHDPSLHLPEKLSRKFHQAIVHNWPYYKGYISQDRDAYTMAIATAPRASTHQKMVCSSLYGQLRELSWIPAISFLPSGMRRENFHRPDELLVISPTEANKFYNSPIFEFMPVWVTERIEAGELIDDLGIVQLQSDEVGNYGTLLAMMREKYPDPDQLPNKKGFRNFNNRVLSYLHDFLARRNYPSNINFFREQYFLAENVLGQQLTWLQGKDCLHVDDKSLLDTIIENDLLESISNPFAFTKKDKKEWGRFGNLIGRSLKKLVSTSLQTDGDTGLLLSVVPNIEVILAFLEEDLGKNYSVDGLLKFKEVKHSQHQKLDLIYTIEGKDHPVMQHYYVTGDKDPLLHLSTAAMANNHTFSLAITSWLEALSNEDLVRFELVVEQVLKASSKQAAYQYALEHNIDPERIKEIAALLENDLSMADQPVPEAEPTASPRGGAPRTLPFVPKQTEEPKVVVELEMDKPLSEYFEILDDSLLLPVSPFQVETQTGPDSEDPSAPHTVPSGSRTFRLAASELAEKAKNDIGFIAEIYIYKKLQIAEPTLLAALGLTEQQARSTQWFNLHRMDDLLLADGSRGKGHDFYLPEKDLAIEVKGMMADTGLAHLTSNEFNSMRSRGERYFLVIVKQILGDRLVTVVIPNPYQKIIDGQLKLLESKLSL